MKESLLCSYLSLGCLGHQRKDLFFQFLNPTMSSFPICPFWFEVILVSKNLRKDRMLISIQGRRKSLPWFSHYSMRYPTQDYQAFSLGCPKTMAICVVGKHPFQPCPEPEDTCCSSICTRSSAVSRAIFTVASSCFASAQSFIFSSNCLLSLEISFFISSGSWGTCRLFSCACNPFTYSSLLAS